jgi:hypothetical protein
VHNHTQKPIETPDGNQNNGSIAEFDTTLQTALTRFGNRVNLEESARYSGALRRRRVIKSAMNLLRLVMTYCLTDYSLRMVGLWSTVMEWGSLSKSGVRKRLRQCQQWISILISSILFSNKLEIPRSPGKMHLRLIDVSNVSQPGSCKIDWRLHLSLSLSPFRIDDVRLTDGTAGETLTRWQFQQDDLVLADRVYGAPPSLGVLFATMACFVIRIGWSNLPVQDREGKPFVISDWLRVQSSDPASTPAQVKVWVVTPQGRYPLRLIARAIPPEKAEKIRQRLLVEAKHKKRRIDERSVLAAGFVMVASNLPENIWSAVNILALYRFRWQIELLFKQLKGLLSFDHLRATDPQMAQVYLLTKILIALLLGETKLRFALTAPDTLVDPKRPISSWRLTQLLFEAFRNFVCGALTANLIQLHMTQLTRYLCDDPRHRQRQLASFQNMDLLCGY